MIVNPILQQAFDNDWYYPWSPPSDVLNHELYQKAIEAGWHEWVETELDFTAMKHGYVYDQSYDTANRPCYWIDGHWQLHDGDIVEVEDEYKIIGHVGRGDQFMRFAETFLKFAKEPLTGQPYRFIPWMRKLVAPMFGWVHRDSRYRRFTHAYVAIAKKNGKSDLLSVISNFGIVGEGKSKSYVYGCACDRNQAGIIYNEAASYVRNSDLLSNMITIVDSKSRLVHIPSGSFYHVLSADAYRNDGVDAYMVLIDELHRHPNRKLYSVMKRAGRARQEKLLATITTYGPSVSDGSIWAEVHTEAKYLLEGKRPDDYRNMAFIASAEPITVVNTEDVPAGATRIPVRRLIQPIDVSKIEFDVSEFAEGVEHNVPVEVEIVEPAKRFQDHLIVKPLERDLPRFSEATANLDWRSDHAIKRANPSVGIIFPIEEIQNDIQQSRTPETEAETKQLSLNIVSGSGRKAFSWAAWQACGKKQVQPKSLIGRSCYAGLDFSFGNDLIGFAMAFPNWQPGEAFEMVKDPRVDLLTWAWLPTFNIEEREEKESFAYRHYAQLPYLFDDKGCIRFCEGTVIDFSQVANEIIEILGMFQVTAVAYDPNYASFCIPKIEDAGFTCVAHRQGAVSMSPPCKRYSQGVYKGWIAHGNNPILDRAVEGAVYHPADKAGNTYLSKGKSYNRIDPLVASVMAVGFCCDPPEVEEQGAYADSSSGMWG